MKINRVQSIFLSIAVLSLMACNNGPKVITSESNSDNGTTDSGIFSSENTNSQPVVTNGSFTDDLHTVVVNEIIPTSKYVYLKVTEAGQQFWIAARKQDVNVGNTYFYRGGLLKTNYECKECNKVFDTIYLVSNLVAEDHRNSSVIKDLPGDNINEESKMKEDIPTHTEKTIEQKGSVKIADIVADPKTFEGKTVQLSGKCVKINPNIMDRNWIHLQDGSKNDFDLVITSNTYVKEGDEITIRALVVLNKDFGAGYKYNLILENGVIIK